MPILRLVIPTVVAAALLVAPVARAADEGSGKLLEDVGQVYRFFVEPEVVDLVDNVSATLASVFLAPRNAYHVHILDNGDTNAFATPSGDFFIFTGLLSQLRSEDELAAVLAHEMAHKEADHFARMAKRSALILLPSIAAMIASGGETSVVASAIAVAQSYQLGFSREMEREADQLALRVLRRTRYSPRAMAGALEVLEMGDRLSPIEFPEHLSTHPPLLTRRANLEDLLGSPLDQVGWKPEPDLAWKRLQAILAGVSNRIRPLTEKPSPEERYLHGLALLSAGRPAEAATEIGSSIDVVASPSARLDFGRALLLSGRGDEARAHLEAAQKGLPQSSLPLFYLGELEREAGRVDQALFHYRRAADRRPELSDAWMRQGSILVEQGNNGEGAFSLGVAALLKADFPQARRLMEEASRLLGESPFWKSQIEARMKVLQ